MTGSSADYVRSPPFKILSAIASVDSPLGRLVNFPRVELHSFFALCFIIGSILLLAYLTNPTEASFRAFVTELAFRRHLTKLSGGKLGDDVSEEDSPASALGLRNATTPTSTLAATSPPSGPGFHFSNRATVSLRTPAHVFWSFGLFTIVIITPITNNGHPCKDKDLRISAILEGSWYIGAFRNWWVGGTLDFSRTRKQMQKELLGKEEGSAVLEKAGVLSMGAADRLPTDSSSLLLKPSTAKTTKVKRRRSVARKSGSADSDDERAPRSATPPPLPQSVSLPLHSARMPPTIPSKGRFSGSERVRITPAKAVDGSLLYNGSAATLSRSLPTTGNAQDQHPDAVETLREIRSAQASLSEVQHQFATFSTTTSTQRQGLQETLDEYKDRKLQDEQARNELKTRMKTVEDARQAAELNKRGVERRLKGVQTQYDAALARVTDLEREIQDMQKTMADDESRVVKSGIEASDFEATMAKKLDTKRQELKRAEDLIKAFERRTRELESSIRDAKLKLARVKAERKEKDRQRHVMLQGIPASIAPPLFGISRPSAPKPPPPPQPSDPATANEADQSTPSNRSGPFSFFTSAGRSRPQTQGLGLLQRRNIPPAAEPEPLQIPSVPATPSVPAVDSPHGAESAPGSARPRAVSLAGNASVTIDTSAVPGFTAISNDYRTRNMSSTSANKGPGVIGQGFAGGHSVEVGPPPSGRRTSLQSTKALTFSPFSEGDSAESLDSPGRPPDDPGSLSTFATSLLGTSLVQSMDGSESSPSADGSSPELAIQYAAEAYGKNDFNLYPHSDGWQATRSQNQGGHFTVGSKYSSPDLSLSSPVISSPSSYISPMSRFADQFENHRFDSPGSSSFDQLSISNSTLETVEEDKATKHRRWFPSFVNSQAAGMAVFPPRSNEPVNQKPKIKSGLNPDAKVFSLSRGRASLLNGAVAENGENGSAAGSSESVLVLPSQTPAVPVPATHSSFASRMYGSLTHGLHHHRQSSQTSEEDTPAPSTPTGNFFSSLLAFAPSPAERQALQRGLEKSNGSGSSNHVLGTGLNSSREFLPVAVSPFTSPLASAQTSRVDLHHSPSAVSAPWDRDVMADESDPVVTVVPPPSKTSPVEKRSFSSLWLRNKAARTSQVTLADPVEIPVNDVAQASLEHEAPPAFGGRFARFTRQKASVDNMSLSKDA